MPSEPAPAINHINYLMRMLLDQAYDNLQKYPFLFLEFYEIEVSIQTPFRSG